VRTQLVDYEQAVVGIMRSLPVDRQAQVVDFARFVQWKLTSPPPFVPQPPERALQAVHPRWTEEKIGAEESQQWDDPLNTGSTFEEIQADNTRWDTLLASSESQSLLETMARQAREQFHKGQTKPMTIGRLKCE
jgi:hypothetical protein